MANSKYSRDAALRHPSIRQLMVDAMHAQEKPFFKVLRDEKPNFHHEADRLLSLDACTSHKYYGAPRILAREGFYNIMLPGNRGLIQCIYCGFIKPPDMEAAATVLRHKHDRPDCPLLTKEAENHPLPDDLLGKTPERTYDTMDLETYKYQVGKPANDFDVNKFIREHDLSDPKISKLYACLGIITQPEAELAYASLSVRLGTFHNWPCHHFISPEELATSGFYYKNDRDKVVCYRCRTQLSSWALGDTADIEHARWSPSCAHIRQIRGKMFVDAVEATSHTDSHGRQRTNEEAVRKYMAQFSFEDWETPTAHPALEAVTRFGFNPAACATVLHKMLLRTNSVSAGQLMEQMSMLYQEPLNGPATPGLKTEIALNYQHNSPQPEENKDGPACKVCWNKQAKVVFVPCSHLACCSGCADPLLICPVCRADIIGRITVFI